MKANNSQYSFIIYMLSKRGLSQVTLARLCRCSPQFINALILGKKRSEAVEDRVAKLLGFRNWSHLQMGVYNFEVRINAGVAPSSGNSGSLDSNPYKVLLDDIRKEEEMMGAPRPASKGNAPIGKMLADIEKEG